MGGILNEDDDEGKWWVAQLPLMDAVVDGMELGAAGGCESQTEEQMPQLFHIGSTGRGIDISSNESNKD